MRYSGSKHLIEMVFYLDFFIFDKLSDVLNNYHDRLLILKVDLPFLKSDNNPII